MIVGGMSVGTLLTIFVVPTMYTLLSRRKTHKPADKPALEEPAGAIPAK